MYNIFVNGNNVICHYSAFYSSDAVRDCLHEAAPLYGEIPASCQLQVDENFNISLPMNGNVTIEMEPLPKALYLLFLRHPEGIVLKNISDYRAELECIYRRVSRRRNPTVIHRLIGEITNPAGNLLHKNLSIIRAAFLKKIAPEAAQLFVPVRNRGRAQYVLLDASRMKLPLFLCS